MLCNLSTSLSVELLIWYSFIVLNHGMVKLYVSHVASFCSDPRSQFPANVDSVGGILTIFRADSSNAGVYDWTGSNRAGSDRESIDVSVRRSSGPSEGRPPVIANLPDRVNVPVNQKVELTCMVSTTVYSETWYMLVRGFYHNTWQYLTCRCWLKSVAFTRMQPI